MVRRRRFFKAVGATAALGTVGVSSAKSSPSKTAVRKRLRTAFMRDKSEGVKQEAEQLGLDFDQGVATPEENDEVSTQKYKEPPAAELSVLTLSTSEPDEIAVFSQMSFDGTTIGSGSMSNCEDCIGIGFNNDHWSSVGEPNVLAVSPHEASFYGGSMEYGGVAGRVDIDPYVPPQDGYVEIYASLKNLDGIAGTIWGHYEHTGAFIDGRIIDHIEAGAGPFTVSLSGGHTKWEAAAPSDPESALG